MASEDLELKGIVHPKMKILSSFTHPQVVPNLYECLCSAEHKGRYSEECGKQSSSGALLTSIVFFFPTMEVNGAPKQPVTNFLQNIFCVRQNKEMHTGLELLEWVNDDRIFIFGWTIPLKHESYGPCLLYITVFYALFYYKLYKKMCTVWLDHLTLVGPLAHRFVSKWQKIAKYKILNYSIENFWNTRYCNCRPMSLIQNECRHHSSLHIATCYSSTQSLLRMHTV